MDCFDCKEKMEEKSNEWVCWKCNIKIPKAYVKGD
jgi:DNA-directed RNA polymerase subunit RPC12/RpoP